MTDIRDKNIAITGAAGGIGAALARELASRGARLVLSDINLDALIPLADGLGAHAFQCDASDESSVRAMIEAGEKFGDIDMFVSNAGFAKGEPSHAASASNEIWEKNWQLHVMSHVYASRILLPKMIKRQSGHLVNVASAAGLLAQIGDAAYSATKHAAVSLAESLCISHGDDGIKVSVVCPQYVNTDILALSDEDRGSELRGVITPEQCAVTIVDGIENDTFMILPHPEVLNYAQNRANSWPEWLSGMRHLRRKLFDDSGHLDFRRMFKR